MKAGRLRHRITLQRKDKSQDPNTGEIINGWVDVATVWASVEPLSVREFIASDAGQAELNARIVIRHRNDIDADMRIKFRGKIYNIEGVLADKISGLEYITLPVSEGVNDG